MQIYVGNMSYSMTEEDLEALFSEFGKVSKTVIIVDRETNRAKGFGFVTMENDDEAKEAISSLNEKEVGGRTLRVNEAKPKENRPRRDFNNRF
jgi:RNA recognition motif-containing protein